MQYFFWSHIVSLYASQVAQGVKNPPAHAGDEGFSWVDPWLGKIPKSRKRQPTPVFLPGKFHGQRSLVAYSPRGGGVGNDLVTACTHTQSLCILLLRRCVSRCKCCSTAVEGARSQTYSVFPSGLVYRCFRIRMAQQSRICLPIQETQVWSLGLEDPPEKEMATHSSVLAWEIPWTEEIGGLRSREFQKSSTPCID